MILKPNIEDVKVIGYYLVKVIIGLGLTMVLPVMTALVFKEINPFLDYLIGLELTLGLGLLLVRACSTKKDARWMHGMIVVSLSWVVAMFLAAVPLYLGGHFKSYLDACFESMSGLATTGLTLVQDLDHMSYAHNLWRHLIMFIGG
ncbi:MAG: TrkH family potassium uptake protein, partial [Candidatus Omnitrophica bacterium]|nr:TrkH family potassium uptake protein [Candidatus Omnitrophota bacterium]